MATPAHVYGGVGLGDTANPVVQTLTLATVGGYLYESSVDNLTATAGGGQTNALALSSELSRIATVTTAGDSVRLPPSAAGLTVIVENASVNAMQVFGAGTDLINGTATASGVSQMGGSVVIYSCYSAGNWYANGLGTGYSGSLETQSSATGLTAHAGGGQASGLPLTTMMSNVTTTASAGDSVVLPASAAGLQITVANNGAQSLSVFAPAGSSMNGTMNGWGSQPAASVGIYFCISATAWISK